MPSLFRNKRRSTIVSQSPGGSSPTPPLDVTVEPLALHKLRTLLHRGSRLSLRLGADDAASVRSASLQVDLANDSVRSAASTPNLRRSAETAAAQYPHHKVQAPVHHDMPALAHKPDTELETEAEGESGSASTTPPTEACRLPELEQEQQHSLSSPDHVPNPNPSQPPPHPHPQAQPHTPPRQEPTQALPEDPEDDSVLATTASEQNPQSTPPKAARPSLTLDTDVSEPTSAQHHSSPNSAAETYFSTASDPHHHHAPSSPVRATRAASGGEMMHPPNIAARRRSSAVSAVSAYSTGSPRRMAAVLHSAPMPIPISNLPHLGGQTTTPSPSWGTLALEGGPRSPALSRVNSRASASNGFPNFPPTPAPQPNVPTTPNTKELTDAEVRRATKAMPVMLRVPSRQPEPADADDEEIDDDDDDDEDSNDLHEVSTSAPLPHRPAHVHKTCRQGSGVMEAVAEESRAGTPHTTAGSLMSSPQSRPPTSLSIGPETPSSLGLSVRPWSSRGGVADAAPDDASSVAGSLDSASIDDDDASGSVAVTTIATPATPNTPPLPARRPSLYSHSSQSMINLPTPTAQRAAEPPQQLHTLDEGAGPSTDWARPPATPWGVTAPPPLKRRLSAGDADPKPPSYDMVTWAGHDGPAPKPREEEGHERLPGYWCGVHIEGTLSRKMEFIQPGCQARDRAWKKHYFVLHGTALFVYKFDPSKVPLRMGEPYLTCSERESNQFLHVHLAPDHHRASVSSASHSGARSAGTGVRRATVGTESAPRINAIASAISNARRGTIGSHTPTKRDNNASGPDVKNPALFEQPANQRKSTGADSVASSTASAPIASHMPFAHNQLLHVYSMQGAESGLAADYKKRLHCVRVRIEGQQFMLQTETARQCVQWIEAFQAATNVAQDLDTRPMPVQQTLPRRRRRRAARATATTTTTTATSGDNASATAFADTPEGNIAAVVAAENAQRERNERERERMLAEDQAAEAQGQFRT